MWSGFLIELMGDVTTQEKPTNSFYKTRKLRSCPTTSMCCSSAAGINGGAQPLNSYGVDTQ
jgi:hypothetical protein